MSRLERETFGPVLRAGIFKALKSLPATRRLVSSRAESL